MRALERILSGFEGAPCSLAPRLVFRRLEWQIGEMWQILHQKLVVDIWQFVGDNTHIEGAQAPDQS